MSTSITIKHVGPLKDTGEVRLSRFNVIVGKQSTGKSTFMKVLCYCQWIEKNIMTENGDEVLYNYTHYNKFLRDLKQFHCFSDSYFSDISEIRYVGEGVKITFTGTKKNARIVRNDSFEEVRHNTKLCFIPSERNLVTAIKNIDRVYRTNANDVIFNHILEWGEAKEHTTVENPSDLSVVGDMDYYYDSKKGADFIRLRKEHKINSPFYASSGVQSVLPIVVMTDYFTSKSLYDNKDLSKYDLTEFIVKMLSKERPGEDIALQTVTKRFNEIHKYKDTKLFIEEPEQNLFPESQQALVNHIVKCVNRAVDYTGFESSLTLTTHSPYIITAFNVLLSAFQASKKSLSETEKVVPGMSMIPIENICAYYIDEEGGMNDIIDKELNMISGVELDNASTIVEDKLALLNDIIYG